MADSTSPTVAILMCTYNGARYIERQMESFYQQSYDNWELWISDDGSTDDTLDLIQSFRNRGKPIEILRGPRSGFSQNFLTILRNMRVTTDYFAWSDQDDIWFPDKLERAVAIMKPYGTVNPVLYSARTELIDSNGNHVGFSAAFHKTPGFANALCQNIGGGNTMVFNRAARNVLREGWVPKVKYHDWWAYILLSGIGGAIIHDPTPVLQYRQHGGNQIGENRSIAAKFSRLATIFNGEYHKWNFGNVEALAQRRHLLSPENRQIFDSFALALRETSGLKKFKLICRSKIYRQSRFDDWVFRFAALCHRYP
ncbi:MAG: glycosyltransferase family 2 protein [Planctomycetes bacterium]|nr:glycosyltransferase family 2 protein [Planctomycetota bacterium]MCD7896702.1 glycosyltransferase family 2 protein [Planctomycetaceae bacterium]